MVSTRACTVESKSKGKKNEKPEVNNIGGGVKIKMEANNPYASCSNDDSEEDEQNVQKFTRSIQSGSALKVTLKKTRSCSSSSRESAQSFEVVKSVPATYGSNNSGEEDDDDQKDSEHDELDKSSSSDKQNDDETMEKESDDDSQSAHSSGKEDDGDRMTGSPQESIKGVVSPAGSDTEVSKLSINKVVDLKTEEIPQNSATVKTEEIKLKIKSLKEELLKEADLEDEVVILKEDYNNEQASKTPVQNGVEKKESKENVKEQKFKVNVRSFDDLAAPHTANLINMPPPAQIEASPNFLTQNGAAYPPFINLTCNVCGITFDTSELLTEHKITLKHLKCTYKECEPLLFTNLQELMDHQRLLHNIMPSSVQQLEHQVQRIPSMGYEQQIQPGRPLADNLPPPSGVPNMYTQTLRMPMQRGMRPIVRQTMPQMISNRGRGSSIMRGRAPLPGMMRGGSMKRSVPMPVRQTPPMKRMASDRNNINSAPPIVKSLSESLTKSMSASSKSPVTQKDVVNLLGKRGLTISTVDTTSNISIPAGLSLNSAVSIIPTSPSKKLDTVDLTGPDKPRSSNSAAQYYPCVHCAKTFLTVDSLNEHISLAHKSAKLAFKCNLCGAGYPNSAGLNQHKQTYHKGEMAGPQYVIPVIDVNRAGSVARLQSLGITNYLPVGQLNHQGGEFGLPIMNIMRPGSLDGLGATNYFNLGPIKKFTKY